MKYLIIYILNLIDYGTTLYWINLHGISHEINPVMRTALSMPFVFTLIKVFLFPALLYWMWKKKHHDTAYIALGAFLAVVWMNVNTILNYML